MDMFVVPTISFRPLYGLLILRHSRRELVWLGVTTHPNAEWIARQLTEACGWKQAPRYPFAIEMARMGTPSFGASRRWAFAIVRSRHGRHGRTDTRRGSSGRSDGIVLIMSWVSASSTFATYWDRTNDI